MPDFLLELLTEEIPARMQPRAADDLARLFGEACAKRGLSADVTCQVTPRRLALFARGLPKATKATIEERRGPRADAPSPAVEGFLRSTGLSREALEARETPKGRFLYATIETPGRPTGEVLPDAVADAVAALPWPKSMRWGAASASMDSPRWIRPLTGVLALLDSEVVPLTVLGVEAGRETRGHRLMGPRAPLSIDSVATYAAQLRAAHVILDPAERRRIILDGARAAAASAGLMLIEDDGLVAENAGLTEWPVPLLGRFDPAFLEVPREVIQLTMRTNQKYFACAQPLHPPAAPGGPPPQPEAREDLQPDPPQAPLGEGDHAKHGGGALAPAFVCVANIAAADGGATIVEGNRRVLAARLSDARFFWEQDLREWREAAARGPDGLWEHFAPKLERVTFHEKLGTMRDKAERVAALAEWLVTSGAVRPSPLPAPSALSLSPDGRGTDCAPSPLPSGERADPRSGSGEGGATNVAALAAQARRAALLAKCDLVSAAVGEFPELQGVMGGHYAAAVGEDAAVAASVRDHYKPVGPSDGVPTEPVSVAVALADKLDSLIGFSVAGERATGSTDAFGLRRAALAVVRLTLASQIRLALTQALEESGSLVRAQLGGKASDTADTAGDAVWWAKRQSLQFLADRLKVQQREAGVRHDLIDAVFALGNEDDLVRLLARVRALQAFMGTADGANLLAAHRRAANILKQANYQPGDAPLAPDPIPQTGEEDPLVLVDDPDFAPVVAELARSQAAAAPHPAQAALEAALADAEPRARAAIAAERFEEAMAALAQLRGPIDAFFDQLMVNDPDPAVREARLALLHRFVATANAVADFSKIEG